MPVIRTPTDPEFGTIGSLFHNAVHQVAREDYTREQLKAWSPKEMGAEHWKRRTAQLEVRVATLDGAVAGFIGFSRGGYIDLLFTRPQSTRRGVARALVGDAERMLAQLGVNKVWTQASPTARKFFEKEGYKVVQEQKILCGKVRLKNFRMEKRLGVAQKT